MRNYPTEDYELKEIKELNAEQWQINMLKMNPSYVFWGPYEDYMYRDNKGWESRCIIENWDSFDFGLDELNEVVNFYFEVTRENVECESCNGGGYNEKTKIISDNFYRHSGYSNDIIETNWSNNITDTEVETLVKKGRLRDFFKDLYRFDDKKGWQKSVFKNKKCIWVNCDKPKMPSASTVNEWNKNGMGHDAINRWILIEARANALGVWGYCKKCDGNGHIYTEPKAKLGLVLWVLHPRKGCSRGVHVKEIKKNEVNKIIDYLKEAEKRNTTRFSKLSHIK